MLVTGANGVLGREIVAQLKGFSVREHDRDVGDLRDLDHVRSIVEGVSAVVHAAAIPSPFGFPDEEVFLNNVASTYNVLDAAGRAGIRRVVVLSSASAIGFAWSEHGVSPQRVPVDDEHPYVGDDPYGLSKQVGEVVAGAASRRWGLPVVSLRFPFVGTGERLRGHLDAVHADPGRDRRGLWSWLDTRDAARSVIAALDLQMAGHHVITVAAPDTTALTPTGELIRRYHPSTKIQPELGEFQSPFSTRKAREVLGFEAIHRWRS